MRDSDLPAVVPKTGSIWRRLVRCAERLLAIVGLCFILYRSAFELTVMTSASMAPTLRGNSYDDGDRILVEKVSGWFRAPRRWEIYYFYDAEGTPVAKRIVGLPGETISIEANHVCINGTQIRPPKSVPEIKYFAMGNLARGQKVACGNGYYVLGDDSADSYDSRFLGPVEGSRFRGRIWCIVAPRNRAGWVR